MKINYRNKYNAFVRAFVVSLAKKEKKQEILVGYLHLGEYLRLGKEGAVAILFFYFCF
jgi:hypothetical protein